jgi:hypothetical protein
MGYGTWGLVDYRAVEAHGAVGTWNYRAGRSVRGYGQDFIGLSICFMEL